MFLLYIQIMYKYGIPYITMTAAYDPWGSGVTALPSVEPAQLAAFSGQMSFFERLQNFGMYLIQLQGPYMMIDFIQVFINKNQSQLGNIWFWYIILQIYDKNEWISRF